MRILIAEDERATALALNRQLSKAGYPCDVAVDGAEALLRFGTQGPYDALITDWLMPNMDGVTLVRKVRETIEPAPSTIMATSLDSPEARSHALDAGADAYLTKPVSNVQLLQCLQQCFDRRDQPATERVVSVLERSQGNVVPPCVAVAMTASTGGPETLVQLFEKYSPLGDVANFLVLHGPEWMMEDFAKRLDDLMSISVRVGEEGASIKPGELYIAPGDRHLVVSKNGRRLRILDEPPENFVRPAADPLFRSIANAFGRFALGVVLTGLGHDGTLGAEAIHTAGGAVVVQDPKTAAAASMPRSVVERGIASGTFSPDRLGRELARRTASL